MIPKVKFKAPFFPITIVRLFPSFSSLTEKDYSFKRCLICSKFIYGRNNYVDHMNGRLHNRNLRLLETRNASKTKKAEKIENIKKNKKIESSTLHSDDEKVEKTTEKKPKEKETKEEKVPKEESKEKETKEDKVPKEESKEKEMKEDKVPNEESKEKETKEDFEETEFDEESLEREYDQAAVDVVKLGFSNCRWCKVRCISVEKLNLVNSFCSTKVFFLKMTNVCEFLPTRNISFDNEVPFKQLFLLQHFVGFMHKKTMQELSEDFLLDCPICDEPDISPNNFVVHVSSRRHLERSDQAHVQASERHSEFLRIQSKEKLR